MRRFRYLPLLLLGALSLTSCRNTSTYVPPTDETDFKVREVDQVDIDIFRKNYLAYIDLYATNLNKREGDYAFPALSAYQLSLTLLSASETGTYHEVAQTMATDVPDEFSLVQGFNHLIAPYMESPSEDFSFGASLWMVWPIVLDHNFQEESAARIGSDVVRLGSFGLTAQNSVTAWLDRHNLETLAPTFDRSTPIISLAAFSARLNVQIAPTERKPDSLWLGTCTYPDGSESPFRIVAWPATLGIALPPESEIQPLFESESPRSSATTPLPQVFSSQIDLVPLLKENGADTLITGPNDLRNMSVEIIPQGDKIGIPLVNLYTKLSLTFSPEEPFKEPMNYAIYDRKTKLPLVVGRFSP